MSLRKKTPGSGRNFTKGNQAAVGPRVSDEIRKVRELTTNEFVVLANKYRVMSYAEAEAKYLNKEGLDIFEMGILAWLMRAAKGDYMALELFLQRLIGRIPQQSTDAESNRILEQIQYLKRMPHSDLQRLVSKVVEDAKLLDAGKKTE